MAKVTSGSFNTGTKNSRYLTFSWSCTQDTSKNQSTINWELKCNGSASGYNKAAPFYVEINGEQVYYSATRIELWVGTKVASGSKTITHNADGTCSFSASAKAAIYDAGYNVSGSGSWDLKDIPRAATIDSAPNFDDTQSPTITYTNPQGNNVTTLQACISFDKSADNIAYRNISKTGTSYTFSFTDAEREVLRKGCTSANSMTVYFYIKTIVDGTTFYRSVAKTLTIKNGSVTIAPTVVDTNEKTIALTGDASKLIKHYSNAKATVNATARKHATVTASTITHNGSSIKATTNTFNKVESNVFDFSATDSRKNTVTQQIKPTMVNYVKLTCDLSAKAELDADNTTKLTLNISGNYFNGSFGATSNSLTVYYQVREDEFFSDDWIVAGTPIFDGNTYSIEVIVSGLDYRNTYNIQARAVDKLSTIDSAEIPVKTVPVFDWSGEDFNFNVPVAYQGRKLFYTSGDTVTFNGAEANFAGCVSDGAKRLYFTIPLSKPVMANGFTLTGYVIGRSVNGYVNGTGFVDATAVNMDGVSGSYTVTKKLKDYGIDVICIFNSTVANTTNNTPVNFHPYGTLTLTFN